MIKIKCPFDGAILTVKKQMGMETKSVTCPVCHNRYPFTQFKVIGEASMSYHDSPNTCYPHSSISNPKSAPEPTQFPSGNYTIGQLVDISTGRVWKLMPGCNIIGRKASKSSATIQIETGDNRSMSREHIVIEVKKVMGGFVHNLALFKEKVNKTQIGANELLYGDKIILAHGNLITLPGVTLKFEIPDEEETKID